MDSFDKVVCRVAFGFLTVGLFLSVVLTQDGARAAGWPSQAPRPAPRISGADQQFAEKAADDPVERASFDPAFTFFKGGVAAFRDGRRVGSVGVSGLAGDEDDRLARAAIDAAGLQTTP